MKTKQIKDGKWVYAEASEPLKVGDKVEFSCNGAGRGGHYNVSAIVTGIKGKFFGALEAKGSYRPGTNWKLKLDASELYVVL
jgi:hypothetical protein